MRTAILLLEQGCRQCSCSKCDSHSVLSVSRYIKHADEAEADHVDGNEE